MVSKSAILINTMLVLRIVTLAASAVTVALVITNNVKFDDGTKFNFQDVSAFRLVLAVAAIAAAYSIVQLPFAIYYAVQQKRLINSGFLAEFDFYGDKVISYLLAIGTGAGIAVSLEFKQFFGTLFDDAGVSKDDPTRSTYDKYYNRGIIASAVLSKAFLAMVIVSILSSINRSKTKGFFG